jgi:hypothetical protein
MANSNGWGDGAANNNIGWGQGAINNSISWGKSHISSWSGATDIEGGNAPVNTVAPAITGTAQEGQTLTCSTGTWTGTPTYTYQWKRNGSNIGSATNSTYTLVTADVSQSIKCTVTATNALGSSNADSNTVIPISAFTFLLDTYPSASVAYSLRKLRSAYTGNCIKVRRSSDNTSQDIGFINNVLDTSSLLTFCGAGDGFVSEWYDQSGNTKNATQITAANQPRIVNAGNLDLVNGKAAVLGDGSNDTLRNTTLSLSNPSSIFTVVDKVGTSGNFGLFTNTGNLAGTFTLTFNGYNFYQNGASFSPTYVNNNQSLLVTKTATTGTDWEFYGNNTAITGVQNIGTTIGTVISLFDRSSNASRANLYMQEYIVWNSNQMTNRVGIQTQINTYYTIY